MTDGKKRREKKKKGKEDSCKKEGKGRSGSKSIEKK